MAGRYDSRDEPELVSRHRVSHRQGGWRKAAIPEMSDAEIAEAREASDKVEGRDRLHEQAAAVDAKRSRQRRSGAVPGGAQQRSAAEEDRARARRAGRALTRPANRVAAPAAKRVGEGAAAAAGDGGGLVFGLIAYAVGMAYLREGSYGIRRWLSAKFINRVLPAKGAGS